jgi:hypothetical protein
LICPICRQAELGSRRSPAKVAAARANGKLGGRRPRDKQKAPATFHRIHGDA